MRGYKPPPHIQINRNGSLTGFPLGVCVCGVVQGKYTSFSTLRARARANTDFGEAWSAALKRTLSSRLRAPNKRIVRKYNC